MHVSAIVHFCILFFTPLSLATAVKSAVLFCVAPAPRAALALKALVVVGSLFLVYEYLCASEVSTAPILAFSHPLLFAAVSSVALRYSVNFTARVLILVAFRISAAVIKAALNSPGSLLVPIGLAHGLMPLGYAAVTGKPVTKNGFHLLAACVIGLLFLGEVRHISYLQAATRLILCALPLHGRVSAPSPSAWKSSPTPLPIHTDISKQFSPNDVTELHDLTIVDEDALIQQIHALDGEVEV